MAKKARSPESTRLGSILFTTFTRNLAADIRAHLATLCRPDEQRRIDVVHLDAWVADLLKRAGYVRNDNYI
jgi:hypothetical protein